MPGSKPFRHRQHKDLEFFYGESDISLRPTVVTLGGCGSSGPSSGKTHERTRGSRHHAHPRRQQGRYRETATDQPGSLLRSLPRDLSAEAPLVARIAV